MRRRNTHKAEYSVSHVLTGCIIIIITGYAVAQNCCKGDQPFQRKNPKFDTLYFPNPLTCSASLKITFDFYCSYGKRHSSVNSSLQVHLLVRKFDIAIPRESKSFSYEPKFDRPRSGSQQCVVGPRKCICQTARKSAKRNKQSAKKRHTDRPRYIRKNLKR